MKRKCILHVGTMKTGTTSIQAWLREQESWLRGQGWVYPGWPMRTAEVIEGAVTGVGPDENLIISDEGLWVLAGTEDSDTRAIRDLLTDFDTTVVVYIRRPDQYLESWFLQGLKAGTSNPDLGTWLRLPTTSVAAMRDRLELFVELWGEDNLVVAPFERSQLEGSNVVSDFLHRSGLPVPTSDPDGEPGNFNRNISPRADLLLMASLLRNQFEVPEPLIQKVINAGRPASARLPKQSVLTPAEASSIRDAHRPFYEELQRRFRTGSEPAFIEDWGPSVSPVAMLRSPYDEYMESRSGVQSPTSERSDGGAAPLRRVRRVLGGLRSRYARRTRSQRS